jgi:hypothetical protein
MVDFTKKPEGEEPSKPPGSSTEINISLPSILAEAGGSLEKAVETHAMPWYMLVFGLKDSPPKFPPNPGLLMDSAAKIVKKAYFHLAQIFNAYEEMVREAREAGAALQTQVDTLTTQSAEYDKRLKETEAERDKANHGLNDEKRLVRNLETERDAIIIERDTAQGTLATRVRELDAAIAAKEKFERELAAKSQDLVDALTAKQQVEGELATALTEKQQTESALATRDRELLAAKKAKETAENCFADLKPQFEKVSREYSELMTKFSRAMSEGTALAQENIALYTQIEEFMRNVEGLTAALTVEQKRAEDLEKRLQTAESRLSKSQLRVRSGWYAAAAASLIGIVGYIGWSITERPVIVQPPPVVVKPKEEKPETLRYLMGAMLYELPDNQFVASPSKNLDFESRSKSVRYLMGADLVEFEDKKFVLTSDRRALLNERMSAEKSKLGRDLTVAERKALYDKIAIKYVK